MLPRLVLASAAAFVAGLAVATWSYWADRKTGAPAPALEVPVMAGPPADGPITRVLLAGVWSPTTARRHLGRFARCLEEETGGGTTVVLRETYADGVELLRAGGADVGLLCSGAAASVAGGDLPSRFDAILRLGRSGDSLYNAVLVVREGDTARVLEDLQGAEIAWTDSDSLTGYFALRAELRAKRQDPDAFFGSSMFTHGHDRSIEAVRGGLVRAATVDEMIFDSDGGAGLRIIWRSDAFPSPPVVVRKGRPDLVAALGRLATRPECLRVIGATELIPTTWDDYRAISDIVSAGR